MNPLTITVTTGSRMYFDRTFSMSRARVVGSFPSAGRSSKSGAVILPSGRTVTVMDSSGLRHTETFTLSPAPIL